jgi:hypothetical protein
MTWGATNHDASIEKLNRVQGSLTVGLIMVERANFLTCSPNETARAVKEKNVDNYSFLPVLDEQGQVIGLYDAQRWFENDALDTPIGDDYQILSERIVIGADASIFDFLRQAQDNPTNLVISGNRVSGLVSLHDVQQLPVRSALFALITSFEMAMAAAIVRKWKHPSEWMAELSAGRQNKLKDQISLSRREDAFVSEIAFTQFDDKVTLICKAKFLAGPKKASVRELKHIRDLRDNLAHANSYADTKEAAEQVCKVVHVIYMRKAELLEAIGKMPRED